MKEIQAILAHYAATDWATEKLALGTVVEVEASSYRRIGARILVGSSGRWTGGISGGCLEGDALRRALMAIASGKASTVVYDTLDADDHQIGVGLGCNGRIVVRFLPLLPGMPNHPIALLQDSMGQRTPRCLVHVLDAPASWTGSYLFAADDCAALAVQAGLSTADLQTQCTQITHTQQHTIAEHRNAQGLTFRLLFECLLPQVRLLVVGDNYDVDALLALTQVLGWEVHLFGKTTKFSRTAHAQARSIQGFDAAATAPVDDFTAVVLMSHDYKVDLGVLPHFLSTSVPYIGLLGPKKRLLKMEAALLEAGHPYPISQHPHLYGPTGLDIGAATPEEIALSITAEIVAVFRQRAGHFLRLREGSIY